jgi:urease accessory protein
LIVQRTVSQGTILGLFLIAGLLHGYALAESIIGAEPMPLYAYFAGFAAVQIVIALAAMMLVRTLAPPVWGQHANVRLIGAGIVGLGIGAAMTQVLSSA